MALIQINDSRLEWRTGKIVITTSVSNHDTHDTRSWAGRLPVACSSGFGGWPEESIVPSLVTSEATGSIVPSFVTSEAMAPASRGGPPYFQRLRVGEQGVVCTVECEHREQRSAYAEVFVTGRGLHRRM